MNHKTSKLLPVTVLAILLISAVPAAIASTLTIDLNPKTKLAKVTSVSTIHIVLTYPAGSPMSTYLKGVNSSLVLHGTFTHGDEGVYKLQSSFDDEDDRVVVQNMSVSVNYSAKGNATTFVVNKETDITAWVSGIFEIKNGSVTVNLRWRSFEVPDAFNVNLEGRDLEVNYVGSAMEESLYAHASASSFLLSAFGGEGIWHRPTLNFSSLNSPLSTWTKNYNSVTNTTTFSKTITGNSTLKASIDYNGQKYALSAISDPSAVVSVAGYADASGDSLVLGPTPGLLSPLVWVAAAAIVLVAVGGGYFILRSRASRGRAPVPTPTTP